MNTIVLEYKSNEICIKNIMAVDIITKEDLKEFKIELLEDLQKILNSSKTIEKKWLKSNEVRKILKISHIIFKVLLFDV